MTGTRVTIGTKRLEEDSGGHEMNHYLLILNIWLVPTNYYKMVSFYCILLGRIKIEL